MLATQLEVSFSVLADAVAQQWDRMSSGELYVVDIGGEAMTALYLDSFPPGSNPVFRERTEHDCSCCKQFIRNVGNVVSIKDGEMQTIWDVDVPEPYATVVGKMAESVKACSIVSVFRTSESKFGSKSTAELREDSTYTWNHFHCKVADKHKSKHPEKDVSDLNAVATVLKRGLLELSQAAIGDVLDLINDNLLYRGAEFKAPVEAFAGLLAGVKGDPDIYAWDNINNPAARFRNTVIGTLVQDISDGVDMEKAVKSFEAKVAPQNYKRPSSLITPKMIASAMETLQSLGLESAIERRFARLSDVSVNDVLFVDNTARQKMKGGLEGLLLEAVKPQPVSIENATEIGMEGFLSTIVPQASTIDLLLENKHLNNFVSITAPAHDDAGRLFKWDNGFAWSYDGDLADSDLTRAVVARGGAVKCAFRFSHSWNYDKRNASLMDLHVFMPGSSIKPESGIDDQYGSGRRVGWNNRQDRLSKGMQDVDYIEAAPPGYVPVENISFPNIELLPNGKYICKIHNWNLRHPTQGGFKAEIEFGSEVFEYEYTEPLKHKQWVTVAVATLHNGQWTIEHHLKPSSSSKDKWGVSTRNLIKVDSLMLSPNYWSGSAVGNKHWFFILNGCANPIGCRGIYNEFLRPEFEKHRKVFEILGSKTKCPVATEQLSGVGFSSTRSDVATVVVKGSKINKAFSIKF